MKNLLRVVALFVVVVLVASGCSYSEEAENRVRNTRLPKPMPAHLSDDCERTTNTVSWGCLTVSEQQRAAGLFNAVNMLTSHDGTPHSYSTMSWHERWYGRTELLRLLIDFEALEVLCYLPASASLEEEGRWPVSEDFVEWEYHLMPSLFKVRNFIEGRLSKVEASGTGGTPVLEPIRYRHLCPSWILEFLPLWDLS